MEDNESAVRAEQSGKKRSTLDTRTGKWSLGKTIGGGCVSKVKVAKSLETGEQIAIKIVPRSLKNEHLTAADRDRADCSLQTRIAREEAILSLVNHPHICSLRDSLQTQFHSYLLLDYIDGGQLLDYIICHGRLKEKGARKFARQIASALDYCHRNSIVHRGICIENIMVSKTGDIKFVGFHQSNLFSPQSHLSTPCGGYYFPPPEMLESKPYIGPKVDIWSFGVVLYVLVCGKVPFDDPSLPNLYCKIKTGSVEYPQWLSAACKDLLSRMLVTDWKQRASLNEIGNHSWMTKGFNNPPENYLPYREPLQLPLDPQVVHHMHGFDFGDPDYITEELTKVLLSDDYQRAVRNSQRKLKSRTLENGPKRSPFDFFGRKNSTGRDALTNLSNGEQRGDDPMNAFSPLISIYYLVREKLDRQRAASNPGSLTPERSISVGRARGEKEDTLSASPLHIGGSQFLPELSTPSNAGWRRFLKRLMEMCRLKSATRPRVQRHGWFENDYRLESPEPPSTSSSTKSIMIAT